MTTKQLQAIKQHGLNLLTIFPDATERDPLKLCKKLRRLELRAGALALKNCNVGVSDDVYSSTVTKILDRVDEILDCRRSGVPVFFNGDPRGYTLKIGDEWMRREQANLHQDWGGYGIIAPEIDADGQ